MSTPNAAFTFEPASKAQAKARIALAGPSGSGKTYTALTIATAFGGPIAVIDTERGSASKYAGIFQFDRLNMQRYDPRDLPKALAAAAARDYTTVIIDSLSKFWGGQGGMLEQVDNAAKRGYGGNSFGGWKEARPMETAMIEAILSYPGHVIVTMRTKTAYEILEDDRGRKVPTKIGLKPEQRDGIEYEFDIVGDMDLENTLTVSKSRCPALSGEVIRRPAAPFAEAVLAWLTDGEPVLNAREYRNLAMQQDATHTALRSLYLRVRDAGLLGAAVTDEAGDTLTLGQLITNQGKRAEAAEVFGREAADPAGEPAADAQAPADPPAASEAAPAADPAANGERDPWATPASGQQATPPRIRPEDQGAKPAAPKTSGSDDDAWVNDFTARVAAAADGDQLQGLQREIGHAVVAKKIRPDRTLELSALIRDRRHVLQGAAA